MAGTKNGLKWSAVEKVISQGIQLVTLLILARLLTPETFGLIAMTSLFISVAQLLVDGGFTSALVRKGIPNETEYSTAFFFNFAIGIFIYLAIFLSAPYIGIFYGNDLLIEVLRVLGFIVIINSLTVVHRAKLNVELDFKTQSKVTISASLIGGVIGVLLASNGFGVWSLVVQSILIAIVSTFLYFYIIKWRPLIEFDVVQFKDMFSYGYKLTLSSLIEIVYANSFIVIIGKLYSAGQLGLFYQAQRLIELPTSSFIGIIQRVNLPLMSKEANNDKIKEIFSNSIISATFIFTPLICAVIIFADLIFYYILGPSWLGASKYLVILCGCYVFYPVHAFNLNLLQVKKRSDLFLKIEIIKKIIGVSMMLITYRFGVAALCFGIAMTSLLSLFVNCFYTFKVCGVTIVEQLRLTYKVYLTNFFCLALAVFAAKNIFDSMLCIALSGFFIFICLFVISCQTFIKNEFSNVKNNFLNAK